MRRRRGETSLFEILRGPSAPEPKRSWWNKGNSQSDAAKVKSPKAAPAQPAAKDSATKTAEDSAAATAPRKGETPAPAEFSTAGVPESTKRRNAVAAATPEIDTPIASRGFWAKVKKRPDSVNSDDHPSRPSAQPAVVAEEWVAEEGSADEVSSPYRNRIAGLTGEHEQDFSDQEPGACSDVTDGDEAGATAAPRLSELPEVERRQQTASGPLDKLNNSVEVRYATILLYSVGVLLALFLAYHAGSSKVPQTTQELTQAAERPSYQIDSTPTLPRTPIREVKSKTGSPESGQPGASTAAAADSTTEDTIAVVVLTIPNRDAADIADNLLLKMAPAERQLGMRAKIRLVKKDLAWIYFGFPDLATANQKITAIKKIREKVASNGYIVDFDGAHTRNLD